ncbi:hypothetical protein KP509_15G068800 [Ceratopteris richardii]|uniref:Uncharacterized protein n=1 Tax=Ceratopteris richardii TaxID=49495 RepID=A0A8T2T4H5_CERRI|nr:hypothetical protein KP509_15G068800 [Ceratopteris richardii]
MVSVCTAYFMSWRVLFAGSSSKWFSRCFVGVSISRTYSKDSYLNDIMEIKGGKNSNRVQYEAPLGYVIEEVRPHGGIKKFHCAAYFNCARKPS